MANALNEDIMGKHVVIPETYFKPEFHDIKFRVFKAEGGFGCSPHTSGTAVFGETIYDGDRFRIEGYEIERLATDEEVALATPVKKVKEG